MRVAVRDTYVDERTFGESKCIFDPSSKTPEVEKLDVRLAQWHPALVHLMTQVQGVSPANPKRCQHQYVGIRVLECHR